MIKKGKHFLFGCALVFAIGASANVASAETIVSEATADQTQQVTETGESESSATAVDNAQPSSDSQVETDLEEASSSQAAPAAIAYRAYEVRYVYENGQVIHKTANVETTGANGIIVQADAIPEGYELAQGQTEYVTHTFTAEEVNVVTIQIVKKAEVVHAADKTVLEQVTSEADLLADEALRQVAKEQAGNTALETAAQATKATAQEAQVVLADTTAVQEVVDAQVEIVKASTKALHDEMLTVDVDGTVTAQLSTNTGSTTATNPQSIYVFRNTAIQTVDGRDRVSIGTITDPDGIRSMTAHGGGALGYTLTNAGEATGTPTAGAGFYSRAVNVTDNTGATTRVFTNSATTGDERYHTYILETATNTTSTRLTLNQGDTLQSREADILSKVTVNSGNGSSNVEAANDKKYRKVIVPGQTLSAAGGNQTIMVRVITASNVYKDVPVYITAPANPVPEFKNTNSERVTTPKDVYIWKDTPMRTEADLSVVSNGATINEVYFVEDETSTRAGGGLNVSTAGKVSGQSNLAVGTHNVDSIIKYNNTSEVRSGDRFWIAVMDAVKTGDVTKNLGDSFTADSLKEEVLNKVDVQKGNIPENWGSASSPNADWVTTKKVVDPNTGAEVAVPITPGTHAVTVRVTNNQGRYKDVVVNVTIPDPNQAPNISEVGTDTNTSVYQNSTVDHYIFVFGKTEGTTEATNAAGQTAAGNAPVIDKANATKTVVSVSDPENNNPVTITYDNNAAEPRVETTLGSNLTVGTDGKLEGYFDHEAGGFHSRRIVATDSLGAKSTSNPFMTYAYTDKEVDTTPVTKTAVGQAVTNEEIFAKLGIVTSSTRFPNNTAAHDVIPTVPTNEYTREVVGYRAVGGTDVTNATTATLPTSGTYEVKVRTRNIYGQDIYNWVTVEYPANTPTTGTDKKPLYVFNNTPIATVGADTDVADNVNKVNVVTLADPQGINSVEVTRETDVNTGVFNPASIGITVDTDGNASGTPKVTDLGVYSRGLTVTDGAGNTTNLFPRNNELNTYVLDATAGATIQKAVGESVTEQEILDNVTIDPGKAASVINDAIDPKFRKVLAPDQQVPTTPGTHTVKVRIITDSNVYKDVPVTVVIPANTAPTVRQDIPNQYVWKGTAVEPAINANVQDVNSTPERDDISRVYFSSTDSTNDLGNPGAVSITKDAAGNYMIGGTPEGEAGYTWNRKITAVDKQNATGQSNAFNINILDSRVKAEIDKPANAEVTEAEVLEQVEVLSRTVETDKTHDITTQLANDGGVTKTVLTDLSAMPKTGRQTVQVELTTPSGHKKTEEVIVNFAAPETDNATPAYAEKTVVPGTPATSTPSFKDKNGQPITAPADATYQIPADFQAPAGYTAEIDPNTGVVTVKAADGTTAESIEVPVKVTYADGSTDNTTAVFKLDTDGDGTPDTTDTDDDNDNVPDVDENTDNTKPKNPDTDGDGITDGAEKTNGTDPQNPDTTAPEAPAVKANEDGTVTVTPSTTAGDDTKTVEITYTDETGTEKTVPVTKGEDGNWTVPADSDVTVDPKTGAVTIPADKVKDGSTVSAKSKDEAGNTTAAVTDTAKKDPTTADKTEPNKPAVTEVTDPTNLTDDEKAKVKEEVEKANPNFPEGTTVEVGNDGTVTVTYPDKSTDTIPGTETTTTDKTAPAAPEIKTDLNGKAGTQEPVVVHTEPNAKVELFDKDGNKIGEGTADKDGVVTITPTTPLVDGNVTAKATDPAGNTSEASNPEEVTPPVDNEKPVTPVIATDLTDKAGTTDPIKVTGAEPGTTVTLKDKDGNVIGTGTANDKGEVEITPTSPLPEGPVTATSTDKAGNVSDASEPKVATSPDTTAPEAPAVKANEDGTVTVTPSTTAGDDTKTVEITYTDETGTEKTVPVTKGEDGNWTVPADSGVTVDPKTGAVTIPADKVKDGSTVSAKSKDEAGNTTAAVTDTAKNDPTTADKTEPTKPAVTEVADPTNLTDDEKAKVKEEVEKANPNFPEGTTVEVGNDGTVTVTYPDKSTDTIPGTETTTPDKTVPAAPEIKTDLNGTAGTTEPVVVHTEPNAKVELFDKEGNKIGEGTADKDGVVSITPTKPLVEGPVTAKATDPAGNTSTPSVPEEVTPPVDNEKPVTPVIATDLTAKAGTTEPIKVTGAEPGTTVTLKDKDGNVIGTGTANDKGEVEITPTSPLPEGPVTATSTDKAGNVSEPSEEKVVTSPDTTAPAVPTVTPKEDGSITVTPSTTAGDDTKTVEISYTDETGTPQTVTATKGEDGNWTVPADSGVTVDPKTGEVTIPADKVKDGSTVTAIAKDPSNNPSVSTEGVAKNDPTTADKTTPAAPAPTEVKDPANLTDAEKAKVKDEVEKANPNLPAGTKVEVGEDGKVTITYPDKSTDEIPGAATVVPAPQTDA
ncbi:TPA: YPDG domain-containing protein, partial [Streptococcus suis]|nr:YPDG domain-containing protein [Streptococcus suis]